MFFIFFVCVKNSVPMSMLKLGFGLGTAQNHHNYEKAPQAGVTPATLCPAEQRPIPLN